MLRSNFSFFLLLWGFCLQAGSVDTSRVRQLYQEALASCENQDYAAALSLVREARSRLAGSDRVFPDLEVGLDHVQGDCSLEQGRFAGALNYYQHSRDLLQDRGLTQGLLMAEALHKLGYYYQEIKDFEEAIRHFEQSLAIRKRMLGNRHLKIADLYNNLGICENYLGDYDKAVEFHDQALAIRLEIRPERHPDIAQSYNNLGICMENKGEYQLALSNYGKAISQYRELFGDQHRTLADVYLNIGPVYEALGYPNRNIEYLTAAMEIYHRHLKKDHPTLATCYNNLANAFAGQGDYGQANTWYEKSLTARQQHFGAIHSDVAETLYNMGLCRLRQGKEEEAKEVLLQCFQALNYHPGPEPSFEEVNNHYLLLLLFVNLSELHRQQYYTSQLSGDLLQAFTYYQQADQLIDFLRKRYEAIGSKLGLADLAHQVYNLAITLAVDLFELTEEANYREQAFRFSEKSKGLLLLDALNRSEAEHFSGVPEELLSRMKDLEKEVAELEKNRYLLWEKLSPEERQPADSLGNLIFEKRQKISHLIDTIQRNYPKYYDLRYETSTVPVSQIREELLEPGQTVIEYFLGDTYLHIFVINKEAFEVVRVAVGEDFPVWLSTFLTAIRQYPNVSSKYLQENVQQYHRAAYRMFQQLVAPVQELLHQQLIIIPDGELGLLPFGALLSETPEDQFSFKENSYLLQEYTISYNYSVTLLREMRSIQNRKGLRPYLGLAPSFGEGNALGLTRLRYNQEEVQAVRQLVGGKIFSGPEATKANFLAHQGAYRMIHLATHGKADNSSSDYSFLAFSESDQAKGEEALLFVKEIYTLATRAEMVVLSACETGTGALQEGEGIASIARGFSYAGAKSLLATQWNVDDKSTNDLICLFFRNIKRGMSKDQALRAAKLEFLDTKSEQFAHPYFWASFVLIGDLEPIAADFPLWPVAVLALLVVLLGWAYFRRRQKG